MNSPHTPPASRPRSPGGGTPKGPQILRRCDEVCARCPFPVSYTLLQSRKREDCLTMECWGTDALWAIFDGHFSREVASHAASPIVEFVASSMSWPGEPSDALQDAVKKCHETAREERLKGGSTALLVAVVGDALWCCNAGDSRAVVGLRGGGAMRLSVDHRADDVE